MAGKKATALKKSVASRRDPKFFFTWSKQPNILGDVYANIRFFSILMSCGVFLIGCIVLLGWYTGNQTLTRIFPQLPAMKTNTAVSLIFAGISLFLSHRLRSYTIFRILRDLSALLVYLIGALTVFEYIFSIKIGIDELFFKEISPLREVLYPNRMALNSALITTFSGIGLFFLDRKINGNYYSQLFAIANFIILAPTIIAYMYNIDFIYGLGANSKISFHAGLGFIFLNVGIIFARPTQGFMKLIVSSSTGGFLVRRLLLVSILGPFLLSWIILLGYKNQLYDVEFRFLLFTLTCVVLFTYLIWRTAQALHNIDIQKRQSEGNLQFLSQAGKLLAASINYKRTLQTTANLAVAYISDYCGIDMLDENQNPQQIILAGRDKQKEKLVNEIRKKYLANIYISPNFAYTMQTKKSVLIPHVTLDILQESITSKTDLQKLKQLDMLSIMIVPILIRNKMVGLIHFISAERTYTESDLSTAEELASRASLAIENARLFNDVSRALAQRDEFISIASHELKTPITTLKVYTQIIEKKLLKDKEANKELITYGRKIESQINRLHMLIQDLLDMTKVQVGKLTFSLTDFDINILVKEITEDLQTITHTHKILVNGKINQVITADRDRIGQVLINLLTNAIKYSPDAKEILVFLEENSDGISIGVKDFGIGINKNYLPKIFDRFYQVVDEKKKFAGLGMGLYISKEIAIRHGGDIIVDSIKGKGSVFTLTLPAKKQHLRIAH